MNAFAHNTTPLYQLKLSPYQIDFHTHPRITLPFSPNLTFCTYLPPYTHSSDQNFNPCHHSLITKPISPWLLSAEHVMLEIYPTVHRHITNKINSQNSTFEITHLKQLPGYSLVIRTNFKSDKFSQKLKPLRLGP